MKFIHGGEKTTVGTTEMKSRRPYRGQRAFDVLIVALCAPVVIPLAVVIAIAVRATSAGPVIFRQERVGLRGAPFVVLKYRSMINGENPGVPDANRITRVGALLRRTSLDELPQLVNVLKGEMSIVGPRPTLAYQVERYTPEQRQRLDVRPGMTGLAQISGRNALSWNQRITFDLEYVQRQSFLGDVRIVLASAKVVLSGEGVVGHDANDPIVVDLMAAADEKRRQSEAAVDTPGEFLLREAGSDA